MAFCSRCGSQTKEGAQFCDRCGAPLSAGFQGYGQTAMPYNQRKDEKEAILAIVLSVLIPGLGQIYCGKVGRGIGILALFGFLSVISIIPLFFIVDVVNFDFGGFMALYVIVCIIAFIVYVWQIVDAYRCAEDYNRMAPPMRY